MMEVTQILKSLEDGDPKAGEKLIDLVYEELRQQAAAKMANERQGHTLQATALVHEAWVKLSGRQGKSIAWNGRRHFYAAAVDAMRRILIDHARRKNTTRRGGGWQQVTLNDKLSAREVTPGEFIDLNDALDKLHQLSPQKAELAKLRLVGGLTVEETAATLNLSTATVKRHWSYAKAWLSRELKRNEE